jgi:hypothetical protein
MDKVDIITEDKNSISNLAIDGVIFGLMGGIAMILFLGVVVLLVGETPADLMARFGMNESTSPVRGLISHLAVSAIYGALFGALVWPLLTRFASANMSGWVGGLIYAGLLYLLSQFAILPMANSPLTQIPLWWWALGHAIYGLVLGGLFARKFG